ncbi:hypothetical protein VZO05_05300 [Aggregatilineales bacterium SYSU G02658]
MKIATLLLLLFVSFTTLAQTPSEQFDPAFVVAVQRAFLMNPRDSELVLQWQQLISESSPTVSLGSLSDLLASFLTMQEHSAVSFALWWAFNLLVILGLIVPRLRSWLTPVRLVTLLLLVIVGSTFGLRLLVDTTEPRAVVMTNTSAHVGPDESFLTVHQIAASARVRVARVQRGWALITTVDGRAGWVRIDNIEYVIPPD